MFLSGLVECTCNVAAVLPLAPTISSLVWTLPAAQVQTVFR
jgi:hypothetical protein